MNFSTEIRFSGKKGYLLPKREGGVQFLLDCNTTGGMLRIPISEQQAADFNPVSGARTKTIPEIFPELAPELREVFISGTTPAEWQETFGGGEPFTREQLMSLYFYEFEPVE